MTERKDEKEYKFKEYYKYSFTFESKDGETIQVGGRPDDIYRSGVDATMTWKDIKDNFDVTDECHFWSSLDKDK